MGVTFGWNALNSQTTSVLCYSRRFTLTLPGGCCSFQGSQTLQGLDFTCTPLFSVSSFCALCFGYSSPSLGSSLHLPTCSISCPTISCETERNLCPVTEPCSCSLRAVLHSEPVCSCLYDPSLEDRWQGSTVPVSHTCTGKSKQHLSAVTVFIVWARSPFPLPSLMTPSPYFMYKQR